MRSLIAEDELMIRTLLHKILSPFGACDMVVSGIEAVEAFELALSEGRHYNLITLDIMMPEMDGQNALERIRDLESLNNVPKHQKAIVVMVTSLDTPQDRMGAFLRGGCTDYMAKPVTPEKVLNMLKQQGLISAVEA